MQKWFIAAICAGLLWVPQDASAASLDAFIGKWRGGGKVVQFSGEKEDIRCRANNSGGGSSLMISLTCASPSYKFAAQGSLKASGSSVTGNWSITDPAKSGSLSGSTSGNVINASLSGAGASAQVTVSVGDGSLSITFSLDSGNVKSITMLLRK